jgi:iron(III) transport system permease protein
VVMFLTALSAWLSVRKAPGAKILDQLGTTPLVFPGIVLGVGVMQFFLNVPIGIYGTIWIIVWAFIINYLPYGTRYSYAGMLQLHRELEEAAAVSGASPFTSFRRIVLPLLAPSLIAGWLFIFLLATRVLALPVLLSGPSSQTMAVAMFDLWGNGQGPELAALGLLWSVAMTVVAVVFYMVARRSGIGVYGQG